MPRRARQAKPPEVRDALEDLERLVQETPGLSTQAAALAELFPIAGSRGTLMEVSGLTAERGATKLREGRSLLAGEPLVLDTEGFARRWKAVAKALCRHVDAASGTGLATRIPCGLDPNRLVEHVLAGRTEAIRDEAAAHGLHPRVATTVLRLTLLPDFCRLNGLLEPLRKEVPWPHGYCPTCGSRPLLAELRGLQQTRYLRCGLCAADWEFPRLQCPDCGTRDHRVLGFLSVEGQESRFRCATCDGCRGYVKTVQSLDRLSALKLLVYDVATLPLDVAAVERGYQAM
jgi:hypothetical protein